MIFIVLLLSILTIAYVIFNFALVKRVATMGLPQDRVLPKIIKLYLTVMVFLASIVLVTTIINIILL